MVGPGEEYVLPDLFAQDRLRKNAYPGLNIKRTGQALSLQRCYCYANDTTTTTTTLDYETDGADDVPKMKMWRGPLMKLILSNYARSQKCVRSV